MRVSGCWDSVLSFSSAAGKCLAAGCSGFCCCQALDAGLLLLQGRRGLGDACQGQPAAEVAFVGARLQLVDRQAADQGPDLFLVLDHRRALEQRCEVDALLGCGKDLAVGGEGLGLGALGTNLLGHRQFAEMLHARMLQCLQGGLGLAAGEGQFGVQGAGEDLLGRLQAFQRNLSQDGGGPGEVLLLVGKVRCREAQQRRFLGLALAGLLQQLLDAGIRRTGKFAQSGIGRGRAGGQQTGQDQSRKRTQASDHIGLLMAHSRRVADCTGGPPRVRWRHPESRYNAAFSDSSRGIFVSAGTLFVVATPIGNLDDISPRALRVLREVALVAAEDTRHSIRLFQHFGIETPLAACHEHNEREEGGRFISRLQGGEDVALISDAGTPLISDPGFHLVRQAQALGIRVVPVPGSCALIAALSAAGLPSDRFIFEGFLPAKAAGRRSRLQAVQEEPRTLIFYEAPHRLLESLADMRDVFGGERRAVLARELSKTFETIRSLPLAELHDWVASDSNQQRGECVVLVAGWQAPEGEESIGAEALRVLDLLLAEAPLKKAAALAAEITGVRKNLLYQQALQRQGKS